MEDLQPLILISRRLQLARKFPSLDIDLVLTDNLQYIGSSTWTGSGENEMGCSNQSE